jgi:hypothetical protein
MLRQPTSWTITSNVLAREILDVSVPSKGPLEARVKRVGQPVEAEAIQVSAAA